MSAIAVESVNVGRHEIARILRVSLNTVDRLVKACAFPSFKIGGTRLALKDDVEAFNMWLRNTAAEGTSEVEAFELLATSEHAPASEPKHTQTTPEATGTTAPSP
jgi:hypothetical protein